MGFQYFFCMCADTRLTEDTNKYFSFDGCLIRTYVAKMYLSLYRTIRGLTSSSVSLRAPSPVLNNKDRSRSTDRCSLAIII